MEDIPAQEKESENENMPQFGDIVYEVPGYIECILAEQNGTRIIACVQGSRISLYRIEWRDALDPTLSMHEVRYDFLTALAAYKDRLPD